jgi:hypothetical protein
MTEATGTPPPAAPRGDRTGGPRGLQSRRSFVLCAAGVGIGLALDGCSSSPPPPPSPYSGDLRTVALAAALENQAVSAYQALDAALRAGKLGPAFPALAAYLRTATDHHTRHAATWNAILRAAHKPAVTTAALSDHAKLMDTIHAASSVEQAVSAVQGLENQAAQTYTAAAGSLAGVSPALVAASTIGPVEAMHAAALGCLLDGQSAVTSFLGTARAVPTTRLTV